MSNSPSVYQQQRVSGVLLHPTSLPSEFGVGDMGEMARRFIDFLVDAKQSIWQILPMNPPAFGLSPYQTLSAFAGNPMWIDLKGLCQEGWLSEDSLTDAPDFPEHLFDESLVQPWKSHQLKKAFAGFQTKLTGTLAKEYQEFLKAHLWLEDFAFYMTLKDEFEGLTWNQWQEPLKKRNHKVLKQWKLTHQSKIEYYCFEQFVFFRQWLALKHYANHRGVSIVGDIPIFVSHDSAEVWANPHLFQLDDQGFPQVVAGTPPDYFAATGQRWGNPLYHWEKMKSDNYHWWLQRLKTVLNLVDIVRIDHFRGFAQFWEIPATEETAIHGKWVDGPGKDFFDAISQSLGTLPLIAEDLGMITPDVIELRDSCHLPGMKVLQFAFHQTEANDYIPHRVPIHSVIYTGTHDNSTTRGWYQELNNEARCYLNRYLWRDLNESNIAPVLWREALASSALTAVAPMQDWLNLGNEAKMNTPGTSQGNWTWRMSKDAMSGDLSHWLAELSDLYERNQFMTTWQNN